MTLVVHDPATYAHGFPHDAFAALREDDRKQVFEGTEFTFGFDPTLPPEERMHAATSMCAYADAMCAERRAHPRDDLMTVLLEADVDGDKLSDMQLSAFFMLLQN